MTPQERRERCEQFKSALMEVHDDFYIEEIEAFAIECENATIERCAMKAAEWSEFMADAIRALKSEGGSDGRQRHDIGTL